MLTLLALYLFYWDFTCVYLLPLSVQLRHLDTKHPEQLEEIPVSVSIFLYSTQYNVALNIMQKEGFGNTTTSSCCYLGERLDLLLDLLRLTQEQIYCLCAKIK